MTIDIAAAERQHAVKKVEILNAFIRGTSITDISAIHCLHRATVETVVREAVIRLVEIGNTIVAPATPETSCQTPPPDSQPTQD